MFGGSQCQTKCREPAGRKGAAVQGRVEGRIIPELGHRKALFRYSPRSLVYSANTDLLGAITSGNALLTRLEGEWCVVSPGGNVLSRGSTAWRAGAVRRPFDLESLPGHWRLHERLTATAYYCPGTGTLLALDIDEAGALPRDDILLDLSRLAP